MNNLSRDKKKIEIIPAIDILGGHTVRLSQGDYQRAETYSISPLDAAKMYADCGFRRIHVVDLDGARLSSPANLKTLEEIAAKSGALVEWGGGIKSDMALKSVFDAGADYAVIGSVAAQKPEMFEEWLLGFGPERIIFGADLFNGNLKVNGWLTGVDINFESLLRRFIGKGLQRTICTDISKDGMLSGPSFGLYRHLRSGYPRHHFSVSGGIASVEDIRTLTKMGMESVIIGKALYKGLISLDDLRKC